MRGFPASPETSSHSTAAETHTLGADSSASDIYFIWCVLGKIFAFISIFQFAGLLSSIACPLPTSLSRLFSLLGGQLRLTCPQPVILSRWPVYPLPLLLCPLHLPTNVPEKCQNILPYTKPRRARSIKINIKRLRLMFTTCWHDRVTFTIRYQALERRYLQHGAWRCRNLLIIPDWLGGA